MEIKLPNNWVPRPYQQGLWNYLGNGGKRAVALWPRRSGKDDVFLHHIACSAHERVGNYWYALPKYSQARKSMWDSVNGHTGQRRIDDAFPRDLRATTREQEMMIVFKNGSTFQLVGSDDPDTLVGSPPVGVVFSEYALSNPSAWAYIMPILEENNGWAGFNSTPRGNNHFKRLCTMANASKDWFFEKLTAPETHVFSEEQLARIKSELQDQYGEDYGASLFLQEYFASFDAAQPGSVFGHWLDKMQMSGRFSEPEMEKDTPIMTAWDLGRTDATAIWFYQVFAGEVRVLDYHESNLKDIPFYCDILRGVSRAEDSAEVRDLKLRTKTYRYGTHFLPHDARQRTLAAGGHSIHQQMIDAKVGQITIAPRLDLNDQIQATRATFPFVWMKQSTCEKGYDMLRAYHFEWDQETRVFTNRPMHDFSSHGSSAFMTLAVSWKRTKDAKAVTVPGQPTAAGNLGLNSFASLKQAHFRRKRTERAGA